jgi:predicted AAA+ superfamily ATPase
MISRHLKLSELLGNTLSAFLLGPRGTGKSKLSEAYLAQQQLAGKQTLSINLLSLRQQARYTQHPELFRSDIEFQLNASDLPLLVLIDEVQKLPVLLDEVHYFLEQYPRGRIQFLLTGSSARKLKRSGANLLAGRALSLSLHPLSLLELPLNLEKALQHGTLPLYYLEQQQTSLLLEAYVETYLKEEVQAERLVRRLEPFQRFLEVAAQMNGKPVNYSACARDVGVSDYAIRDYYSILVDTYLLFEVPAWARSTRKQLSKTSRFYFFDCGVLNALLNEQSLQVLPGNRRYGNLFETFVVGEFFRQNEYLQTRRKFYWWHTTTNEEVDLVLDRGLQLAPIAIEIKSADSVDASDVEGLLSFESENQGARLFCVCRTSSPYSLGKVTVLPWNSGITEILRMSE